MTTKPQIAIVATLADSFTDPALLEHQHSGMMNINMLKDLYRQTTQENFVNEFVWIDHLAMMIANEYILGILKEKPLSADANISDAIFQLDDKIKRILNCYHEQDDNLLAAHNEPFFYAFSESGITSFDYTWWPSKHITRFFTNEALNTLSEERSAFLNHPSQIKIGDDIKNKILIIEWSGTDDILVANVDLSIKEVKQILDARVSNLILLIEQNYRHFVLGNIPDLTLMPRYQDQSREKRHNMQMCINELNKQFTAEVQKLAALYPECMINIFDMRRAFNHIYRNPEEYKLDRNKLRVPYRESPAFELNKRDNAAAREFMFWDDVYPSPAVHSYLAYTCYQYLKKIYQFTPSQITYGTALQSQVLFKTPIHS